MALLIQARTHPGLPTFDAYVVIDRIEYGYVVKTGVTIHLLAFASQEIREGIGAAVDTIAELAPVIAAGDRNQEVPLNQRSKTSAKFDEDFTRFRKAQMVLEHLSAYAINPLVIDSGEGVFKTMPLSVIVPPSDVNALYDGLDIPQRDLCYEWLMKNGYSGKLV